VRAARGIELRKLFDPRHQAAGPLPPESDPCWGLEKGVDEGRDQAVKPFRAAAELQVTITAVSATAALVIIAQLRVNLGGRFARVEHLRSWVELCSGLNESASKVMSRWLRNVMSRRPRIDLTT
jgi:transposase